MRNGLESREDAFEMLLSIIRPLKRFFSREGSFLVLASKKSTYSVKASYMEAYSRLLWGLVPFWKAGMREGEIEEIYRRGLASGTDRNSPGFWGDLEDRDQKFVEMAAIGYALMYAPDVIWDPLSEKEKENAFTFLDGINRHELVQNNWLLFAVMVNLGLENVGMPYRKDIIEKYLDRIDSFYIGSGWYHDGDVRMKDYYIGWAIQYYTLIYAIEKEKDDPSRAATYRERATEFIRSYIHFFDEDGDNVPYGRSLIYRFACSAILSESIVAGLEPYSLPVMKGLLLRNLRRWMEKPIFDHDGILTIGYAYENWNVAEIYGAPGGPYWALKAFSFLMLSKDHPFWTAKEEPFPVGEGNFFLHGAELLSSIQPHHTTIYSPGICRTPGHGQVQSKYSKFAYDSKAGFSLMSTNWSLEEAAPDSMLSFVIDGYVFTRRESMEAKVSKECIRSKWSPVAGITVETILIPTLNSHRRIHRIESSIECLAYDSGFSISRGNDEGTKVRTTMEEDGIALENDEMKSSAHGFGFRNALRIDANPNLNLMFEKASIPSLCYEIHEGVTMIESEFHLEMK